MMSSNEFVERCKAAVVDYFNNRADKTDRVSIVADNVYEIGRAHV